MKSIIFVILLSVFSFQLANAQWVKVPTGMNTYQGVLSLAASGNNILAGGYDNNGTSGMFLSTNNGTFWNRVGLNNIRFFAFAVNGNNVYSCADGGYGVYLSSNNGSNWTQTSLNQSAFSIVVSGNNIFAGTGNSVYLSTNNGANWVQTSINNQWVHSLAINANIIFAGTELNGIFLSSNNGTNWTQSSLNNQTVRALFVNGNNIFSGTAGNGVYVSTNNGITWTQTALNNRNVQALIANGNNIFAGTNGYGVYMSLDNGTNWAQRSEGLVDPWTTSFCILNNYIFAGTINNTVFRRPLNELIGIKPISEHEPSSYKLSQNYPNPFNPTTKLKFEIPKSGFVKLSVYDALGKKTETLVNEYLQSGVYEISFNADKYTSGVYFYRIEAGEYIDSKKMVLVK